MPRPRTPYEKRIVKLLRKGWLFKDIAELFGVSATTVSRVSARYGVRPSPEVVGRKRQRILSEVRRFAEAGEAARLGWPDAANATQAKVLTLLYRHGPLTVYRVYELLNGRPPAGRSQVIGTKEILALRALRRAGLVQGGWRGRAYLYELVPETRPRNWTPDYEGSFTPQTVREPRRLRLTT